MSCNPKLDRQVSALEERAVAGTHDLVVSLALRHLPPPGRALDLGAGSGALAIRLQAAGYEVLAVDIGPIAFRNVVNLDLNSVDFHRQLPVGFRLITAVEVIEHLESPQAFLRSAAGLLAEDGLFILTTPNLENLPARLKFLLTGKVRAMDMKSPEHITPIFSDLLARQYAPRAGLCLVNHLSHPRHDYPLTGRRWVVPLFKLLASLLPGRALVGDTNVFVLRRAK